MLHLLFLNENPKDVAVRKPVLLNENAQHQLPSVFDRKDCSGAAPCILDRNTASMQLRLTKAMTCSRSMGGATEHTLITV